MTTMSERIEKSKARLEIKAKAADDRGDFVQAAAYRQGWGYTHEFLRAEAQEKLAAGAADPGVTTDELAAGVQMGYTREDLAKQKKLDVEAQA